MSASDSTPEPEPGKDDVVVAPWAFGVFALLTGAIAVVMAGKMQVSGFTDTHDPGPDALPRVLGVLLIIGGVIEIMRGILFRRKKGVAPVGDTKVKATTQWLSGGVVFALVAAYAALLPLLGFALSTSCLTIALLRWLGASWKLSAIMAVSLIAIVAMLFQLVFEVALPTGRLGLPL